MVPKTKVTLKSEVKKLGTKTDVLLSTVSKTEVRETFDIFDFKKSVVYKSIEQAALIGEGLEYRTNEEDGRKLLDLDSNSGSQVCQGFLGCLERLATQAFEQKLDPKGYRDSFSASYKLLFQKSAECGYLTEVLDSAQEGFPHMWVNSEKYIFSDHIISGGLALFAQFELVSKLIMDMY